MQGVHVKLALNFETEYNRATTFSCYENSYFHRLENKALCDISVQPTCMFVIQGKVFTPVTFLSLIPNCFSFHVVCEDEGIPYAYFKRISIMSMLCYKVHVWIILLEVDFECEFVTTHFSN